MRRNADQTTQALQPMLIGIAIFLLNTQVAAATISGNFAGDANGASLTSSDSAGTAGYAATNWNNLSTDWSGNSGAVPSTVKDGSGATVGTNNDPALGFRIEYDSAGVFSTGAGAPSTGDQKLMRGYLDDNSAAGQPYINLINVPYPLFDVVLYLASNGANHMGAYWIQSQQSDSGAQLLTPKVYGRISAQIFSGFQQMNTTTNSAAEAATNVGNWLVFEGLTGPNVTIRSQREGALRASIAGFQIVPSAAAAPSPQALATTLPSGVASSGARAIVVNHGAAIPSITAAEAAFAAGPIAGNARGLDATINHGSGPGHFSHLPYPSGASADQFVYQATGLLQVPSPGNYVIGVNSDDGFRLRLGTNLLTVSDFLGITGSSNKNVVVSFPSAGLYPFRLLQFDNLLGDMVELYAKPGTNTTFDGTERLIGDTGNGGLAMYANGGFFVRSAKSTGTISTLANAEALLAGSGVAAQTSGYYATINFWDSGTQGRFSPSVPFPLDTASIDLDFAVEATGTVFLPEPGVYTFGIDEDDGAKVAVNGVDVVVDDGPHSSRTKTGTFTATAAGFYPIRFVYYQRSGDAHGELFAAKGSYGGWDAGAFRLIGDVANGGLQVFPNACGDGVVQGNEQCDLGSANGSDTACCSAACQWVSAGTTCRSSGGDCYQSNVCSGSSPFCPSTPKGNGAACSDDGSLCTTDLCNGGGTAYVGFTASTGGSNQNHFLHSWSFRSGDVPTLQYANFSSTAGLQLVGNATTAGNQLRLTPNSNGQVGAAWATTPQAVQGGFDTTFQFQITNPGADGFAFVVHNSSAGSSAIGGGGNNLGYAGISNSLAVEFDTHASGGEMGVPHVSIQSLGGSANSSADSASLAHVSYAAMTDGAVHSVRITYEAGRIDVYLDGATTPSLSANTDLTAIGLSGEPNCVHAPGNAGLTCRASAGECDPPEACTGSSPACPADARMPAATACGDDGNPCTADRCDGSSVECQHPAGNPGMVCRGTTGECDPAETCTGGSPICPDDLRLPPGTTCSEDGNPCSLDQCDGSSSACQHPAGNPGVPCRASAGECDPSEACTGLSTICPADVRTAAGSECASDHNPCTLDACDGNAAACQHLAGNAGVTCRASAGECDLEESCNGIETNCPADVRVLNGTPCSADDNPCTLDQCNGTSPVCEHPPGNAGTVCRPGTGECNPDDTCTGSSSECPPDQPSPAGTACTDDGNPCTADRCDGSGADCQHSAGNPGAVCRAAAGLCDLPELCDGIDSICPADAKSSEPCRPSAGICDVAEACDGHGDDCPPDLYAQAGVECRGTAGSCDVAEQCSGDAAHCPTDVFLPADTECRASTHSCDGAERCSGHAATCPAEASPLCIGEDVALTGGSKALFWSTGASIKFAKDSGLTDFPDPTCPAPPSWLQIETDGREATIELPCENWTLKKKRYSYKDDLVELKWESVKAAITLKGTGYASVRPLPASGVSHVDVRLTIGPDAKMFGPQSFCARFTVGDKDTASESLLSVSGPSTACPLLYPATPTPTSTAAASPTATSLTPVSTPTHGTALPSPTPTPSTSPLGVHTPTATPSVTSSPTPDDGVRVCHFATTSKATISTAILGLGLNLRGYQRWIIDPIADEDGVRQIVIPNNGTHFDRVVILGQTFCIRMGGTGEGFLDCNGTRSGYDITSVIDHNTDAAPGANGGLPADPMCTATFTNPGGAISSASRESSSDGHPHDNVCNSPTQITTSGSGAAGGMQLTEMLLARIIPSATAVCPSDDAPYDVAAGDIFLQGVLTTGTAAATVYDAENNLAAGTNRVSNATGAPFGCGNIDINKLNTGKLVFALPALDLEILPNTFTDLTLSVEIACQ